MNMVLRGAILYFLVLLVFRITGKRSLAQITTFDFVLLLIISETTQEALLGNDFSITNSFVVIVTLMGIDVGLSLLKRLSPGLETLLDSAPLVLIDDGKVLEDRMRHARVDRDDVLMAARHQQGLERLDQIKYAVLERSGGISIVPKTPDG